MPTETFFNLPKEKQQRLLKAAQAEFSRVPLKEASIAKIVKAAEISRGSFYQYFADKEDLYYYYFENNRQMTFGGLAQTLKECQGDLFLSYETYFSKLIGEFLHGENRDFYQNVFTGMDFRSSQRLSGEETDNPRMTALHQAHHEKHRAEIEQIRTLVDRSKLKVNNEEELRLLMRMMMHTVFTTIAGGFRKLKMDESASIEDVVAEFKLQMSWLQNGAEKKGEN